MEEPNKIYIGDLRKALAHIFQGKEAIDIQNTNIIGGEAPASELPPPEEPVPVADEAENAAIPEEPEQNPETEGAPEDVPPVPEENPEAAAANENPEAAGGGEEDPDNPEKKKKEVVLRDDGLIFFNGCCRVV